MRKLIPLVFALMGFGWGLSLITPDEAIRGPAAVPPMGESSSDEATDDSDLRDKIVREILNSTTTERRTAGTAVRFASANQCDGFEKIEITLIGEGVATSGEPTELKIIGPCAEWTTIPFEEIYRATPANGVVAIETKDVFVEAKNIADDWPPEWYVGSVTFVSASNIEGNITVGASDYRKAKGRSVAIYW